MKNQNINYSVIVVLVIMIILCGYLGITKINLSKELVKEKEGSKMAFGLLALNFGWDDDKDKADSLYEEASLSYERQNYLDTEAKCKLARNSYSKHSQNLKEEQLKINFTGKIFDIYHNMLDEEMIISDSMYEACEYFEEAARHFDFYYKANTPSNDPSYDMGGLAIDSMNKKINSHDDAVKRYNSLLAEYNLEKEKIIKEYQ
jgi:hypothetical protein